MLGLYLMSEKGYTVLNELIRNEYHSSIQFVIGAQDRNVQKDFYLEIKHLCTQNKIPFYDKNHIPKEPTDYVIAISWRWLIKQNNLIVIHDSLLPRYRGFAALVWALINGDTRIGITAVFAEETYDTGNIIAQETLDIQYPIKINTAIQKISQLYTKVVFDVFKSYRSNPITGSAQDNAAATYSLWRDEEDYQINWSRSATEIRRFIDAVGYPYKGASVMIGNKKARILDAVPADDVFVENRDVGKVIFVHRGKPIVVCGTGLLKINEMQWEDGEDALPLKNFRTRFQ